MIWFGIYAWLNARGVLTGIHWKSPDIYIPIMVYPYVFGMLVLVILPFAYNFSSKIFYRLLLLYAIVSLVMFIIYYFYPVYMLRRDYAGELFADALMRRIVGLDDPANCFPSNHCALATLGYIGVQISAAPRLLKIATLLLTLLVCLSTVLVGQHYWIDIPTGIGLSAVIYFIYSRNNTFKVESWT
ncbi:MAG: phosphatase PAP2 family protein [Candidatus Cloacimonetes bacterium]|nr:phosphatase PAP2 family protein [Candidatus Cloacimonadota bacterium]